METRRVTKKNPFFGKVKAAEKRRGGEVRGKERNKRKKQERKGGGEKEEEKGEIRESPRKAASVIS